MSMSAGVSTSADMIVDVSAGMIRDSSASTSESYFYA